MSNEQQKIATDVFIDQFGEQPHYVARAPGRVNLIGEHTDYNDGFVLPAALHYQTCIASGTREDRTIEVIAVNEDKSRVHIAIDEPPEHDEQAPWSNYLRGVVGVLVTRGFKLTGANLVIAGDVPLGAGLSSSAALEMATISALTHLSGEDISGVDAALAGQTAENEFVGMRCGIMDQLISAQAMKDHALLIDCRSFELRPVHLPRELSLLVVNSNSPRTLVGGEYNARREQCEQAAAHFGVGALRDVSANQLEAAQAALDPVVYRRAHHVITENARTLAMAEALAQANKAEVSRLMAESHASMRDDFEITIPSLDSLVDIIADVVGEEGGARMTGGGFGGCVVALVPPSCLSRVIAQVEKSYPEQTGLQATIMQCTTSDGAFPWKA